MNTIFDLFNAAKKNGGRIKLPFTGKTYEEKSDYLINFFSNTIKNQYYLIAPLEFCKNNDITEAKIEFLDRVIKNKNDEFISVDLFELLNLKGKDKNFHTLAIFEEFFYLLHEYSVSYYDRFKMQFTYDNDNSTIIPTVGFKSKTSVHLIESKSDTAILKGFITDHILFEEWVLHVGKIIQDSNKENLISFGKEGILSPDEDLELQGNTPKYA
jgi:hypothetical protein